jgi:hypothetical protein
MPYRHRPADESPVKKKTDDTLLHEKVDPETLAKIRQRFFLQRCTRVSVDEPLYHGSPLSGLEQIRTAGRIIPQEHGMIPGNFFCVSVNDNMLHFFSEGEETTGLAFTLRKPLQCLQLDWMHYALSASEAWPEEWPKDNQTEIRYAEELGYYDYTCRDGIPEDIFTDLIPSWVDGIILPWGIKSWNWNQEAEIALTKKGCKKIFPDLDQIVIRNEWFDLPEAWAEVATRHYEKEIEEHEEDLLEDLAQKTQTAAAA